MPLGATHDRITLFFVPVVAVAEGVVASFLGTSIPIATISFVAAGWMFGPDLDIRSLPYRRWGWLRWIWIPYQKALKHRSVLSHGPAIGTTVRIVYLFIWFAVAVLGKIFISSLWVGRSDFMVVTELRDWPTLGLVLGNIARVAIGEWLNWFSAIGRLAQQYPTELASAWVGLEVGAASHYLADWASTKWKRWKKRHDRRHLVKH